MTTKKRFDKARAYHRKWCQTWQVTGTNMRIWRFVLNPGGHPIRANEHRESA